MSFPCGGFRRDCIRLRNNKPCIAQHCDDVEVSDNHNSESLTENLERIQIEQKILRDQLISNIPQDTLKELKRRNCAETPDISPSKSNQLNKETPATISKSSRRSMKSTQDKENQEIQI